MVNKVIRLSILSLKIVNSLFVNKNGITIKGLSDGLETDYKNTHDAVNGLFKAGIIKKEKIGNYNICKLNYDNEDVVEYLKEYNFYVKIREFKKNYATEYNILRDTVNKISTTVSPLFICLVFGSYSKNEEKKSSDIDILFLPYARAMELDFKKNLSKVNAPYQKKFHVESQQINDFIKDLKNKDKVTIATELYKQPPIVFYGDDIFFRIIVEESKLWQL